MVMTIPSFSLGTCFKFTRRIKEWIKVIILTAHSSLWSPTRANLIFKKPPDRYQLKLLKRKVRLTDADRMRQVMWVQHALQDGARARQADALELCAQEIDGAAVERVE